MATVGLVGRQAQEEIPVDKSNLLEENPNRIWQLLIAA